MAEPSNSFQEQLVMVRRNVILDAAAKVFAGKGFHRATIKDIAKASRVADGTIYNYFTNKNELLIALLDRLNETERREADFAHGHVDMRSFFVAYVRHRLAVLGLNRDVFQAVLPELIVNPELRSQYYAEVIEPTMQIGEQFFRMQIAQGNMRSVDPALTTRAFAGSIFGLLVLRLLGDQTLASRWDDIPEALATLVFDGLELSSNQAQD